MINGYVKGNSEKMNLKSIFKIYIHDKTMSKFEYILYTVN